VNNTSNSALPVPPVPLACSITTPDERHRYDNTTMEAETPAQNGDSLGRQTFLAASPKDVPSCSGESPVNQTRGESVPLDCQTLTNSVSAVVNESNSRHPTPHHRQAMMTSRETEAPANNGDSPRRQTFSAASPEDVPPGIGESPVKHTRGELAPSQQSLLVDRVPLVVNGPCLRQSSQSTPEAQSRIRTRKSIRDGESNTATPNLMRPTMPAGPVSSNTKTRVPHHSRIPVAVSMVHEKSQSDKKSKQASESNVKLRSQDKSNLKIDGNFYLRNKKKPTI
jgi:hypothetical protein